MREFFIPEPRIPTPEESRENYRPWAERVGPLLIDKWPPGLLTLSMDTVFVPMPKGLVGDMFDGGDWSVELRDLAKSLDDALGFERRFFRLNSRSPKDALWPFEDGITCSGKEVLSVMRASERMLDDLVAFEHTDLEPVICLRKQEYDLEPNVELRCFVKEGRVLAVAEYGREPTLCTPPSKDAELREMAERYVLDVAGPHLPMDTIVVDIWIRSDRTFGLVEVNPYGLSDPGGAVSYAAIEAGIPSIARRPTLSPDTKLTGEGG